MVFRSKRCRIIIVSMDHLLIIGSVAGTLTTIAFLPQVIQAYKTKHTKDLSMTMYLVLSLGLIMWIIYGVYTRSLPVIVANSVTFFLSAGLIRLKIKHG